MEGVTVGQQSHFGCWSLWLLLIVSSSGGLVHGCTLIQKLVTNVAVSHLLCLMPNQAMAGEGY